MTMHVPAAALKADRVAAAVESAVRMIPPVWPLASSVAVNPYLGQAGETLAEAGARLARVAGAPVAMPRAWHRERLAKGIVTEADLAAALAACGAPGKPKSLAALTAALGRDAPAPQAAPTMADLAAEATGVDWPGVIAERFGAWAGGYFDEGQALWAAPRGKSAWLAWRAVATHDLTPELLGLKGLAAHVAEAPETPAEAIARAVGRLGLEESALATYFHALLMSLGGWAQVARYKLWAAELAGGTDETLRDLLAVRLLWEEALHGLCGATVAEGWRAAGAVHAAPLAPTPDQVVDEILQEAAERAAQRALAETLAMPSPQAFEGRPAMQAAFCIDVRSEVFRRALEAVDPSIRTIGFAGFFGVFASYRGFASDVEERRLPVLLNPTVRACAGGHEHGEAEMKTRYALRVKRAWGRFKFAAVSSFAFVEAMGPVYVGKLVRDALGLTARGAPQEPAPRFDAGLGPDEKAGAAVMVLRAMSMIEGFARLVVLAGHGASVVNNPHASALNCGACGGYSGEVNARLLAALLNDPEARAGAAAQGIAIPDDTLFVAALHDTTTDAVTLYDADADASGHTADLAQARAWFEAAGRVTRAERALRLPRAAGEADLVRRSRDWAEVRPEWSLAGCKAFIAAPRGRTAGRSLEGRAFLHDYEWRKDEGFGVLELILTAPVVVASWISLQYYGSVVSPAIFGAGDKLLHNVVGGIGVLEGNGGALRPGLPWQSVHDGEDFAHEPLRLSVCVEAPRQAMTDVLRRHEGVRALFDNRWLHLFALDEAGRMAWRYAGGLEWVAVDGAEPPALRAAG